MNRIASVGAIVGAIAGLLAAGSMLWFGKGQIYTITELADGSKQFDWGSRYHTRSGWDDRMWPRSTYEGIQESIRLILEELGPAPSGSWTIGMTPCTNMFTFASQKRVVGDLNQEGKR